MPSINGINLISTSQLLYRMWGNARTLMIIAVLSATTLTVVGASYIPEMFPEKTGVRSLRDGGHYYQFVIFSFLMGTLIVRY